MDNIENNDNQANTMMMIRMIEDDIERKKDIFHYLYFHATFFFRQHRVNTKNPILSHALLFLKKRRKEIFSL